MNGSNSEVTGNDQMQNMLREAVLENCCRFGEMLSAL